MVWWAHLKIRQFSKLLYSLPTWLCHVYSFLESQGFIESLSRDYSVSLLSSESLDKIPAGPPFTPTGITTSCCQKCCFLSLVSHYIHHFYLQSLVFSHSTQNWVHSLWQHSCKSVQPAPSWEINQSHQLKVGVDRG